MLAMITGSQVDSADELEDEEGTLFGAKVDFKIEVDVNPLVKVVDVDPFVVVCVTVGAAVEVDPFVVVCVTVGATVDVDPIGHEMGL